VREALTDKRTYTIYPLPLDSGGIQICAVLNFINTRIYFGGGFIWKGIKGKKCTFTRYVDFKFLKLIFDRISIPPPKKDRGIWDFCYPFVRLSVRSSHFFVSPTHFLLGRGYLLVNFNYCTSVILIPLLSTNLTLLLWFQNLKEATKWKGQLDSRWINAYYSCSMVINSCPLLMKDKHVWEVV
jgi:hypothetical protein